MREPERGPCDRDDVQRRGNGRRRVVQQHARATTRRRSRGLVIVRAREGEARDREDRPEREHGEEPPRPRDGSPSTHRSLTVWPGGPRRNGTPGSARIPWIRPDRVWFNPRMLFLPRALALAALALALLGASCSAIDVRGGVPRTDGTLPLEVLLQAGQDPQQTQVLLDGADVTSRFTPAAGALVGTVPLPPPTGATLVVRTLAPSGVPGVLLPSERSFALVGPAPAPALAGVDPAPVAGRVPRSAWLRLRFASEPMPSTLAGGGFGLECNGVRVERRAHRAGAAVLLDPTPALPDGAQCRVAWRGPGGSVQEASFLVANAGAPEMRVLHDRDDPSLVAPFPDDHYLVSDPSTPTGRRPSVPVPPYTGTLRDVYAGLLPAVNALDGWSRVAPVVIAVTDALDPSLLPADETAAQDPWAPIALFDLDPSSPEHGRRIPYLARFRVDVNRSGQVDRSILLFPSIALRPRGAYGLVVTRRLFAGGSPDRPLAPSSFFASAAGAPAPGESAAAVRTREVAEPVLAFAETSLAVPIAREDVALALRLSIRSDDDIPHDLRAIKEATLEAAPPPLTFTSTTPEPGGGAVLRGTVALPSYLDPVLQQFTRDPVTGRPLVRGTENVPFVLRLPPAGALGPAPIVMYQHGNPGSPEEIVRNDLNGYLVSNGYAVGGIRDYLNRRLGDVSSQIGATFFFVLQTRNVPRFWNQTGADMIGFLHALRALDGTAWRPPGAPLTPLLDTTQLLYHGISEGGNNALRFLPFAPEIVAATPTVGGGRLIETLLHQYGTLLTTLEDFIGQVRPVQTLVGLSLFQHGYDAQDPHSFARFLYASPVAIAGFPAALRPSVLLTEGIGDTFVPNHATRSAARELGLLSVRPLRRSSPVLQEVDPPLVANASPSRTAGHVQFEPATTPGCFAGGEGHFCPQTAPIAQAQRLHFFETALDGGAPEILAPLP